MTRRKNKPRDKKFKTIYMKIFKVMLWAIPLLWTVIFTGCSTGQNDEVKHVILISLDGSRPEFYMDSSWDAPHLRKFRDQWVYTKKGVKSVFPSFTYPSHTSMVTGAYPIQHGIYNNKPYDGVPGQWLSDAKDIQSKTI